jgi:hypothetical protein
MTDGVLLKEIERDFLLRKYSAVVIDEVRWMADCASLRSFFFFFCFLPHV